MPNLIVHDGVIIIDRFSLLRWYCVLGKSLFLADFFLRLLVQLVNLVERFVVPLDKFLGRTILFQGVHWVEISFHVLNLFLLDVFLVKALVERVVALVRSALAKWLVLSGFLTLVPLVICHVGAQSI